MYCNSNDDRPRGTGEARRRRRPGCGGPPAVHGCRVSRGGASTDILGRGLADASGGRLHLLVATHFVRAAPVPAQAAVEASAGPLHPKKESRLEEDTGGGGGAERAIDSRSAEVGARLATHTYEHLAPRIVCLFGGERARPPRLRRRSDPLTSGAPFGDCGSRSRAGAPRAR